jgi:hypothetical protein
LILINFYTTRKAALGPTLPPYQSTPVTALSEKKKKKKKKKESEQNMKLITYLGAVKRLRTHSAPSPLLLYSSKILYLINEVLFLPVLLL